MDKFDSFWTIFIKTGQVFKQSRLYSTSFKTEIEKNTPFSIMNSPIKAIWPEITSIQIFQISIFDLFNIFWDMSTKWVLQQHFVEIIKGWKIHFRWRPFKTAAILRGLGVKNWTQIAEITMLKTADMGREGSKNRKKLPTS